MKLLLTKIKDEKGQSAVEFALIAIWLMLLVLGIVQFGWTWFRADLLKNAANIGARTCAVKKDVSLARAAAQAAIPNYNSAITTINVPACDTLGPMSQATVTVIEPYRLIVPNLNKLIPITIKPLTRTATYSVEP